MQTRISYVNPRPDPFSKTAQDRDQICRKTLVIISGLTHPPKMFFVGLCVRFYFYFLGTV